MLAPVPQQHLSVPLPSLRVAHRVDQQPGLTQPEVIAVEVVRELDDLDVSGRVVDAEHFDADLPVLPVPALLRPLVAEVGRDVPDLPRRDRLVLSERTGHRGSPVGAQGEVPAALVGEVVHLLANRVGARAQLLHDFDVLEDGRDEHPEAGAPRPHRERRDQCLPAVGLRREDIVRAVGRGERRLGRRACAVMLATGPSRSAVHFNDKCSGTAVERGPDPDARDGSQTSHGRSRAAGRSRSS